MRAVILAAGTGSRLGEITKVRTKGMVPVMGQKLIDYLFDFLDFDSFDEVLVVGGFCYEDLRDHVLGRNLGKVRVLHNGEYMKGNIFTLAAALKEFGDDSFLITNVDHIYPSAMFSAMKMSFRGITAMCDFDRTLGPDDMKVKLRSDGKTVQEISKQLGTFDCGYIGMTYVDRLMEKYYRSAVAETINRIGEKAVVENVLQLIAGKDEKLPLICDLSGFGWYEVDDINDLRKAEAGLANDRNFTGIK